MRFRNRSISLLIALASCTSSVRKSVDAGADTVGDAAMAPDLALTYAQAVTAANWSLLPNAPKVTQGKQDDIWFTSPSRGFAVSGPAAKIYKTEDGGNSWSTSAYLAGTFFRSLLFTDDNHGLASNLGAI